MFRFFINILKYVNVSLTKYKDGAFTFLLQIENAFYLKVIYTKMFVGCIFFRSLHGKSL